MSLSRLSLWDQLKNLNPKPHKRKEVLLEFVTGVFKVTDPSLAWKTNVKLEITRFIAKVDAKLKSNGRSKSKFEKNEAEWLRGVVKFSLPSQEVTSKPGPGRPSKATFKELSAVSKRQHTSTMRAEKTADELAFATHMKLRQVGEKTAANLVQKVTEASPKTLQVINAAVIDSMSSKTQSQTIKPFSPEEALAHMRECKWSKENYIKNKQRLSLRNCNVFPCYERVAAYKRLCYPENIEITANKASVPLQDLLDHTTRRLVEVQNELFATGQVSFEAEAELVVKIGFDPSTNHSKYNQSWPGAVADDSTMLLTAMVPLLLHQRVDEVWLNKKTCSTVFCRPLELEYCKETVALIKIKGAELDTAINNLRATAVHVEGKVLNVKHVVLPTMYDGKVTSALSDTSNQNCSVCHAKPSEMNNINLLLGRVCNTAVYKYGFPVLHANIRFLEYILNIAYRITIKKGYTQYTLAEKTEMANRKKRIGKRIEEEMGLRIDRPSTRGGNTNTGNVARRFFDNPVKVAEITGINIDILKKIKVVLRTLSSGYAIDVDAFHAFCVQLAKDLVSEENYKFWFMPSSVHQILLHGAATIASFPLPIGMLSEEALESCHKDIRYLRTHHTRKCGRKETMWDLFHGLSERSDPVTASHRKAPKPKNALDSDVVRLLLSPNADGTFPSHSSYLMDNSETESDIDDEGL